VRRNPRPPWNRPSSRQQSRRATARAPRPATAPPPGEHGREQHRVEPHAGTNPRPVITEWSRQQRDTNRIYCRGTNETSSSGGITHTRRKPTILIDRQCNKYGFRQHEETDDSGRTPRTQQYVPTPAPQHATAGRHERSPPRTPTSP